MSRRRGAWSSLLGIIALLDSACGGGSSSGSSSTRTSDAASPATPTSVAASTTTTLPPGHFVADDGFAYILGVDRNAVKRVVNLPPYCGQVPLGRAALLVNLQVINGQPGRNAPFPRLRAFVFGPDLQDLSHVPFAGLELQYWKLGTQVASCSDDGNFLVGPLRGQRDYATVVPGTIPESGRPADYTLAVCYVADRGPGRDLGTSGEDERVVATFSLSIDRPAQDIPADLCSAPQSAHPDVSFTDALVHD